MTFRPANDEADASFQIAPMIDIVFLLLVFFIATTALRQWEREIQIGLPTAEHSTGIAKQPNDIIINVTREGRIIVFKREWELEKLRSRLSLYARARAGQAPPAVIIRADGETQHQNVVNVIEACVSANLRNISFVTIEEKRGS